MTALHHATLANQMARLQVGPRPGTKVNGGDKAVCEVRPQMELARSRLARLPARALLALLWLYRCTVSPALAVAFPTCGCRFHPTCSCYAGEAVRVHGALVGAWFAIRRLARCHPFSAGGLDPVPTHSPIRVGQGGWTTMIFGSRLFRGGLQPTAFPAARPVCRRAA